MASAISTIEPCIKRLRAALSQQDKHEVNRTVSALERNLLDNQSYQSIGDERLLAEAFHLLSPRYGERSRRRLEGLCQHLATIRAIHDKLYAILNCKNLDELLSLYLNEWPQLDETVVCSFDDTIKHKLHEARSSSSTEHGLEEFLKVYFQHLSDHGLRSIVDTIQPHVELALEGYKRAHSYRVYALFAVRGRGEVHGLKIVPEAQGTGRIDCLNDIGTEMKTAAKRAAACVGRFWPRTRGWNYKWEIGRDDIRFGGESIALALTIGILAEAEGFDIDAYTAFTGLVESNTGDVTPVGELGTKLKAAEELCIRRVFIPHENMQDVGDVVGIQIVPVGSIAEAREYLRSRTYESPSEGLAAVKISQLETRLSSQGIRKTGHSQREQFSLRVVFTNHLEEVCVSVYHGRRGLKPVIQPNDTDLGKIVQEECDEVFGAKPQGDATEYTKTERLSKSYVVRDPDIQQRVERYIFGCGDATRESENNCTYRARVMKAHQTVFVRQFSSGTLTVDGPPGPLFEEIDGNIRAILGVPEAHSGGNDEHQTRLRAQIEAVEAVQLGAQWIGTDESGKGDYFGPLVGAAVLVDERIAELLGELGVKDSKRLSDKRVRELAAQIRQVCGKRAVVVTIPPQRYNALYAQFGKEGKNLNTLLAWAHTRALEDILSEFPQQRITVLVDRFANESYIQSKLLERGRRTDLDLVQLPKAEANIAVAAASVLARAQFLQWLERLSRQYGVDLPKGASDPRIVELAKEIVARYGRDELAKVAKLHFKTTKRVIASD